MDRLAHFRDLVFSPLALPTPPTVDAGRLVAWMEWARLKGLERGLNRPERGYEAATGKQYPWLMANMQYEQPGEVEESFARDFPEVLAYARSFPLREIRVIALIAQRGGADVHLHADSDGFWGLRFYIVNRHRDPLYFHMARERLAELPRSTDDWSPFVDTSRRHYVRWPDENRPYCVNSVRAAHAVDPNTSQLGERIGCLILPKGGVDEKRMLQLLEESSARFAGRQIWYPGQA
jgi:hypothetical protein